MAPELIDLDAALSLLARYGTTTVVAFALGVLVGTWVAVSC